MYEWNLLTWSKDLTIYLRKKSPKNSSLSDKPLTVWITQVLHVITTAICVNNYLFNLEVKGEQFSRNTDYSSSWIMCLFPFCLQDYVTTNI